MIGLPEQVSIFLYTQPVDFRKGFDGLTGIVTTSLGHNVTDGSLFLFVNRRFRNRRSSL
ncbi:MAG: IS66 family insertion sequence element accessory protein TnpB [Candidatus Paceibacterota bacterium]